VFHFVKRHIFRYCLTIKQTDLTNLNYFITSKVVSNLEKEQKEKFRIFSKPVFDVPENRELTQSMH